MIKRSIEDTSIVFVGAGNLAANLAHAFYRKGFRVAQIYSRTEESARTLAQVVEAEYTTSLEDVASDAQLYIVSLKDDALAELLPQVVAGREKGVWVHTSGSIPMDIWKGHVERYGVFYPLQTFSRNRLVDFREIPVFVEGSSDAEVQFLRQIASALSGKAQVADSEQRRNIHLAAVFTCNFANHMYALGERLLQKNGLPFDILLPLIDETARKVHGLSPRSAQTGPAVRYDTGVIEKHLDMLADEPEMQRLYRLLSDDIHRMVQNPDIP